VYSIIGAHELSETYIDTFDHEKSSVVRYINFPSKFQNETANTKIFQAGSHLFIVSTESINPGEELLCCYGRDEINHSFRIKARCFCGKKDYINQKRTLNSKPYFSCCKTIKYDYFNPDGNCFIVSNLRGRQKK
jgi:hypothetical protein